MKGLTKAGFGVPSLLLALSAIPVLGGALRLESLWNGAVTAENARFLAAPVPVAIHALAATLYSVLGAFQFSRGLRLRWPGWHRRAGKLLVVCGLCVGFTGLWMTALYPIPRSLQGPVLYGVRIVVGVVMLASLLMGWSSILHRDISRHEAWMIRAYAFGQGAGTQALILLPWMLISGEASGLTRDLLMTAAWALNWAVAEAVIRLRTGTGRVGASPIQRRSPLI